MGCYTLPLGSVPPLNAWKGLEPVCKIPPCNQFKQITCPLKPKYQTSKLCNLLPPGVTDSLIDFLANLPIVLLFVASTPARIIYCIVYNFLINYEYILKAFQYSIINVSIDFMTNPLVYLAIGLADGENNTSFSIPYLVGILHHACMPSILQTIYQYIGSAFYFIGYALGFVLGLFIDLYDILLYSICSLVTFSIQLGFCVSYDVFWVFSGGGGVLITIYPFSFLADFIKNFINCGCVLGSYPSAYAVACLNFGGSCPPCCPCGVGFSGPACGPIPTQKPPSSFSQSLAGIIKITDYAKEILQSIQNKLSELETKYSTLEAEVSELEAKEKS